MKKMKSENCILCLCRSCANPDCENSMCDMLVVTPCSTTHVCFGYETQGHYYFDIDGNEYWIGKDNRRHYTRDEG